MKQCKVSVQCILLIIALIASTWIVVLFRSALFPTYILTTRRTNYEIPAYNLNKQAYYDSLPEYSQPSVIKETINYFTLGELLEAWPARQTGKEFWSKSKAHPKYGKSLARLNYMNPEECALAFVYRDKEIPYILYNIPNLDRAATDTFTIPSLLNHFGTDPRMVERSKDNEFIYYTAKNPESMIKRYPDWKAPQEDIKLTVDQYLEEIETAERQPDYVGQSPLHYMTVSAFEGSQTDWIRKALPFFEPISSLFMKEPDAYRGINCRFGMKGVIAAAHFDSRRNYIAMIRGRKRYVLLPPQECTHLALHPRGHPSQRHSAILWSNHTAIMEHPALYQATATEVVLSMGEMMYLPSFWFHYIISQDASIQCNARSGESPQGKRDIAKCGFITYQSNRHQPFLEVVGSSSEAEGSEGNEGEEEEAEKRRSRKKQKMAMLRGSGNRNRPIHTATTAKEQQEKEY